MDKEILTLAILKLQKIYFADIRLLFLGDVDIENALVSNKIYFSEENYKYFISY